MPVAHAPALHTEAASFGTLAHAAAHPPQLAGSVCRSTQVPLHGVMPAGQAHTPPVQMSPVSGNTAPHPLQLFGSVCRSTQWPLQAVVPAGQTQTPLSHVPPPAGQVTPHPPQLPGSVCVSTHWPPHRVQPTLQASLVELLAPLELDALVKPDAVLEATRC